MHINKPGVKMGREGNKKGGDRGHSFSLFGVGGIMSL
jgi:hypothetical protein